MSFEKEPVFYDMKTAGIYAVWRWVVRLFSLVKRTKPTAAKRPEKPKRK